MSLNKCMIIGNLGRGPEMRYTPSGTAVTQFSVAVNRNTRDEAGEWKKETEWFRVVLFREQAERAAGGAGGGGAGRGRPPPGPPPPPPPALPRAQPPQPPAATNSTTPSPSDPRRGRPVCRPLPEPRSATRTTATGAAGG